MNKLLIALVAGFVGGVAFSQTTAPSAPVAPVFQSTPAAAHAPATKMKNQKTAGHKTKKSHRKTKQAARK